MVRASLPKMFKLVKEASQCWETLQSLGNPRGLRSIASLADVAVLHNWPSMAYSINATAAPVTLMEQVLIQYKVPFDILFDEQLDRIGQYAAVILAGQECVSDAQIQTLLEFVRNGGTLVVTGNTGQYNDWRQARDGNPLLPERREGKGGGNGP